MHDREELLARLNDRGRVAGGKTKPKAIKEVRLPMHQTQIQSALAGIKDVTRRPVRDVIGFVGSGNPSKLAHWRDPTLWGLTSHHKILTLAPADESDDQVVKHLYGGHGDIACLTENWRPTWDPASGTAGVEYRLGGSERIIADDRAREFAERTWMRGRIEKWIAARYMPVWACRIRRPIICVTVERIGDIRGRDVCREGIGWQDLNEMELEIFQHDPVVYFGHCWDQIYGEWFPFIGDPWVRRIEFERREGATP